MRASKSTRPAEMFAIARKAGNKRRAPALTPQGHSRWEYKDMAEDIRISVDTARLRGPAAGPRANRFVVLRDAALPIAILGFALLVFIAV